MHARAATSAMAASLALSCGRPDAGEPQVPEPARPSVDAGSGTDAAFAEADAGANEAGDGGAPGAPCRAEKDGAAAFDAYRATDDDFARRELYSWTSKEQAARLAKDGVLLWSTERAGNFRSEYLEALHRVAVRKDEDGRLARVLLEHPTHLARRYAWTAAFATAAPRGVRSYGDVLVRIELAPGAIVGRFAPAERPALRFASLDGKALPLAEATPARIAAIFHVRPPEGGKVAYREYIVSNPLQVQRFEVGTPAVQRELDREVALLRRSAADAMVRAPFEASLAFRLPAYAFEPKKIGALATLLEGRKQTVAAYAHGESAMPPFCPTR
jgi:hypothetical protein